MTDPNEDFCRKLCGYFAFGPYPGHPAKCPCEECNNFECAKMLVSKAIQIVVEKAARIAAQEYAKLANQRLMASASKEHLYARQLESKGQTAAIIEDAIRSIQLSAEDVADSLRSKND